MEDIWNKGNIKRGNEDIRQDEKGRKKSQNREREKRMDRESGHVKR